MWIERPQFSVHILRRVLMYGYVYLTTNLVNGMKYIGQYKSSSFDKYYIGSGLLMQRAIEKYGKDNFKCEILVECADANQLSEKEYEMIQLYNAVESDEYYNLANGLQAPMSELHKKHLKDSFNANKSHVGERNSMYGVHRFVELNPNYGKHYYHIPNTDDEILVTEEVFESSYKSQGYVRGRTKCRIDALHKNLSEKLRGNCHNRGKKWFNDGSIQTLSFECPEGFVPGMLKK